MLSLVVVLQEFKHTWGWVAKEVEALGDAPIIMLMMEFTTWHLLQIILYKLWLIEFIQHKIKVNENRFLVLLISFTSY
jgi:hypothetical protein